MGILGETHFQSVTDWVVDTDWKPHNEWSGPVFGSWARQKEIGKETEIRKDSAWVHITRL